MCHMCVLIICDNLAGTHYPMPVRGGMVLNNRVCPNWMGADHMSVGTLGDDHGPVDGDLPASVSNTCNTATVA